MSSVPPVRDAEREAEFGDAGVSTAVKGHITDELLLQCREGELMRKCRDVPMDYAEATLVALAEELKNSAKSNWTLAELGWSLHPPGLLEHWDGMTAWFIKYTAASPAMMTSAYLKRW